MDVLEQFFSLPILVLCLVIWVLVFIQRKIVEIVLVKYKDSKIWRELLLPIGPPMTGGILAAVLKSFPFPEVLNYAPSGRIFCGIVCGLASGLIYRIIKQFLSAKLQNILPGNSSQTNTQTTSQTNTSSSAEPDLLEKEDS